MPSDRPTTTRRRLLSAFGTALVAGSAGCGETALPSPVDGPSSPTPPGDAIGTGRRAPDGVPDLGEPWPTFGGDAANTGATADTGPMGPVETAWRRRVAVEADLIPTAAPDGVYAGSADGTVRAYAPDGTERWRAEAGSTVTAAPAVARPADGEPDAQSTVVVVGTWDGDLVAFDARDGTELWRADVEGPLFYPPAVDFAASVGEKGSDERGSTREDGESRQTADEPGDEETSSGGTSTTENATDRTAYPPSAYVGTARGTVHAVDLADGSERWRVRRKGRAFGPAVADGRVFVSTNVPHGRSATFAFDAGDGDELWRADVAGNGTAGPAVDPGGGESEFDGGGNASDGSESELDGSGNEYDGSGGGDGRERDDGAVDRRPPTVYVGTNSGTLHAFAADNGDERWRYRADGWIDVRPTVDSGRRNDDTIDGRPPSIYVGTLGGKVHAVAASDGTRRWRARVADGETTTGSTVVGDAVVVGAADSSVTALAASDGGKRWRIDAGASVTDSLVSRDGVALVGTRLGDLLAFDATDGSERWRRTTKPRRLPGPAVSDGTVYVGVRNDIVSGIDATTGVERWVLPTDAWADTTPTIAGDAVYTASGDVLLAAPGDAGGTVPPDGRLRATAGRTDTGNDASDRPSEASASWTTHVGATVTAGPTYADGRLVVGDANGVVTALSPDGEVLWRADLDGAVETPLAVANETAYVGAGNAVYALGVRDGARRWRVETGRSVQSAPAVADGTVFVGSDDGGVYALDARDGERRWRVETGGPVVASPAVASVPTSGDSSTVFVGSGDGSVYAFAGTDGSERWHYATGGEVYASPAVADGTVYVGSRDRHVYALSATDGSVRWRVETGAWVDGSPAVAYGAVYVTDQAGYLYAIADAE